MQRERGTDPTRSTERPVRKDPRADRELLGSEALHVRSYDHQWSYDLDVELATDTGETVFRERYYLLPGHTEDEVGIAPDGEYELRVTLDNSRVETLDCRIDSTPEHTAVIEVGNGAITLSEGL